LHHDLRELETGTLIGVQGKFEGMKRGFKKTKKKFWRNEIKDYLCRTFARKNRLRANKRLSIRTEKFIEDI